MKPKIGSIRFAMGIWISFVFCGMLSAIAIWAKFEVDSMDAGNTVFLCFLPMTFFFVGMVLHVFSKEIKQIRQRLDNLENKKSN